MVSVPGAVLLSPGERMLLPVSVTSPPITPLPPSVALLLTVVAPVAALWSPLTNRPPALTVVAPV
ncbi:Uncharacterised protein [Achromobacter sp. 2789STDY5608615]|nr:Uncharacterised protein [Achromobacter sp. 2789STDY5608615]